MGSSCSKSSPSQAAVNPNDPLGTTFTIANGCAPAGSARGYLDKYVPKNGEYEWAGEGGSCYYCSFSAPSQINCSAGCDGVDCCAVIGRGGTYRRTRYLADPVQCCLQSASMIGDKTCDPKYRNPTSEDCFAAIKSYCIQGDRLFSEDVCKTWCAQNEQECFLYKQQLCDQSLGNAFCKTWCMQNHGYCDNSFKEYCATTTKDVDPACGCIQSSLVQYKYNPICEDRQCIDNGYQTSSMLSAFGDGCQIVDCSVYFDVSAQGNVIFDDINIEQRCNNERLEEQRQAELKAQQEAQLLAQQQAQQARQAQQAQQAQQTQQDQEKQEQTARYAAVGALSGVAILGVMMLM